MDHRHLHARARQRGVNPIVYWLMRALLQPFAHLYWRLSRIGREHIPESGPVIFVANHRSFLDPFIVGLTCRRPVYYVAKQELFRHTLFGWFLNSLGAFPVRRGEADADMVETAKAILKRGDPVLIFPEGTRIRPGALGKPKRGVGRLALETGAPVVPVAIKGTEAIRRGWRIRPHKVRVRVGNALHFPQVDEATSQLAAAVTDRIWPNVMLQWEWLGGLPPVRRAAVIGGGSWGTAVAVMLARAGIDVDLGCRTHAQAELMAATRAHERYLPGVPAPAPPRGRGGGRPPPPRGAPGGASRRPPAGGRGAGRSSGCPATTSWPSRCPRPSCPPWSGRTPPRSSAAPACWCSPRASSHRW